MSTDQPPTPATSGADDWRPRAVQLAVLHAIALGVPGALYAAGIAPPRTALVMVLTQALTFFFGWLGLAAYFAVRAREARGGRWENGRTLVVGMDLFAAVSAVLGVCLWVAILIGV